MGRILVIIPAYNEEDAILNTYLELRECCPMVDVIVINDASTDNTQRILIENRIPYVTLPTNLGIGGGVQTGYRYAFENGYDVAVQLDGDGQHCPSEIHKIVEPVLNGECDMAVGSRFITNEGFQSSALRRMGINMLSVLISLCTKQRIYDCTSGFRAVNRRFIEIFSTDYAQDYPEPEAIVAVARYNGRVKEYPVIMRERDGGSSSISSFKSVYYMIKVSLAIMIKSISKKKFGG